LGFLNFLNGIKSTQGDFKMSSPDWKRVEAHLNKTFGTSDIKLETRKGNDDSVEVIKNGDFLGLVYIDEDEGETSYMFEMAILDIDLNS
jgi:Protein of unknown function (DUF3126)